MGSEWIVHAAGVFFLSMTPLGELQVGIPYGHVVGLGIMPSLIVGVLGSLIPGFLILKLFNPVTKFLFAHSPFLKEKIEKHFTKLHTRHTESFNKKGALFLTLFVLIPGPGSGAWTGALLASLFNIPFRLAMGAITLGIIGTGLIVTFLSKSAISIFQLF